MTPDGTAFVFPGQGSQFPGMGRDLQRCGSAGRCLVADAERVTGLPVARLMTVADATTLAHPHVAQVLVFVSATAHLRHLQENGHHPVAVAGHSLGEYCALVAADVLGWAEALRLVDARGRAMAAAAERQPGAMAALVGLDHDHVRELCRAASTGAELAVIANLNSPTQVVVSGTPTAVEAVLRGARAAGAIRARRLSVGGAYHSPLMVTAASTMDVLLRTAPLRPPSVPLVSSATGEHVTDMVRYRRALRSQVTSPVRWRAALLALAAGGITSFVEVGPGRVLTGLGRDNLRPSTHRTVGELFSRIALAPMPAPAAQPTATGV